MNLLILQINVICKDEWNTNHTGWLKRCLLARGEHIIYQKAPGVRTCIFEKWFFQVCFGHWLDSLSKELCDGDNLPKIKWKNQSAV